MFKLTFGFRTKREGRSMRRKWIVAILFLAGLLVTGYFAVTEGWIAGGTGPQVKAEVTPPPPTPEPRDIATLAQKDPVELLAESLRRYEANIKGYTCTLVKEERINGKLNPPETVEAWFREKPYSVMMHWTQGAGKASASLFVDKENDGMMCIRPSNSIAKLAGYVKRKTDCDDAKETSRYLITEFGLRCGTERTWNAWQALKESGVKLDTTYIGFKSNVPQAGGRPCHIIERRCNPPEDDGMTKITIYIDAETWQQVGTVLEENGNLIGSYFFKDIKNNPTFDEAQFKPETLKKY
jgi:hypothetical protein